MNAHTPRLLSALALVAGITLASAAQSQTAPVEQPPQPTSPRDRIERITNEDALTRIDEVRVGGETKSIDVQPKNGAPAYQINPDSNGSATGEVGGKRTGNAGRSSWRVLNF
ncbi:hypothetical protein [Hydrogenophaga sp.]|uniref:hypothetical protein n=1 Tax=Hydrogenophaga sp. TaxID=1904254 RepID=UPI0027312FC9|nr:hypothetical protein [Hydrogenophaga sp.]MDP2016761.1 hypothetical protein [Hydrogenophaga sp.]MDP3165492.1 hypothetical protein [Hydrogenophaga sp.]MDP3812075.1 hypothetical protein [Hydrogenophaga sp.]